MKLFDQVMHALEGEDPPRTWETQRGPVVVTRSAFVEWAQRIGRTSTPTALECVAIIKFQISDFDREAEQRIVDDWSEALRTAAIDGRVVPRDPVTLLPLKEIPDDWNAWGVMLSDADQFVTGLGMPWTVTDIADHMLQEASAAMAREYEQVLGGREVIEARKAPPPSTTKLDWKQMGRVYATEAWDARRDGTNPSKRMMAESVRKRFDAEGVRGPRGPLTADNILRESLNTWSKPSGPRKS